MIESETLFCRMKQLITPIHSSSQVGQPQILVLENVVTKNPLIYTTGCLLLVSTSNMRGNYESEKFSIFYLMTKKMNDCEVRSNRQMLCCIFINNHPSWHHTFGFTVVHVIIYLSQNHTSGIVNHSL